jgi:uncharacterized protein YcgI (DUF1989 family)
VPARVAELGLGEPRQRVRIPAQSGRAVALTAGELLRVIDPEGEQVADLVAFAWPERAVRLSTAETLDVHETLFISTGQGLYADDGTALLTIVADEVGRHDLLYPWCNPRLYERIWGQPEHPNCHDNLLAALTPFGVTAAELPLPFNIFQNTVIHPDGRMDVQTPLSKPGDSILLRADRDLLIAVSACSVDEAPTNGFIPSPIDLEIYPADALPAD